MRRILGTVIVSAFLLSWVGAALAGEDGRAIVAKAVEAAGGEAKLKKFHHAFTYSEKGTYYGMGEGLPYTGTYAVHRPNQFRMEIQGFFIMVLNGDKGWTEAQGQVKDMTKEHVAAERANQRASAIASLVPLKDKAFEVKTAGSARVGDQEALAVEVSRKDYPTVKLYFDKKTNLLIRSEWRSKAPDLKFEEVVMEVTYSNYKEVEGCKMPHTHVIQRAGKRFVEAEMSDLKSGHPDAKLFAKPAN